MGTLLELLKNQLVTNQIASDGLLAVITSASGHNYSWRIKNIKKLVS